MGSIRERVRIPFMDKPEPGFTILYEHGGCLVVNKPPGVLTQAVPGVDSLEVRVKAYLARRAGRGRGLPERDPPPRPPGQRSDHLRQGPPHDPQAGRAVSSTAASTRSIGPASKGPSRPTPAAGRIFSTRLPANRGPRLSARAILRGDTQLCTTA